MTTTDNNLQAQNLQDGRFQKGVEMFTQVYAGALQAPPEGQDAFFDVMLKHLFGEVWAREALSIRDRRLLLMGAIAALGEKDIFAIQVGAALQNEELTADQIREIIIHLAPYVGYPRVGGMRISAETAIANVEKQKAQAKK